VHALKYLPDKTCIFLNSLHEWQDQIELKVTCVVSKSCPAIILQNDTRQ